MPGLGCGASTANFRGETSPARGAAAASSARTSTAVAGKSANRDLAASRTKRLTWVMRSIVSDVISPSTRNFRACAHRPPRQA